MFPSVKAIGEGLGEKIFYLTAKTITRTVAEQAFRILGEQGLQMKVITLTAKEKICKCEETECNPVSCPYAKGHFDRVNDAVYDLIMNYNEITRDVIEISLKNIRLYVIIIMRLDPTATFETLKLKMQGKNIFFQMSKVGAHSVERGREMYSARLYKRRFRIEKMMRVKEQPISFKKSRRSKPTVFIKERM